jgi:hypothetical protein
MRPENCSPALPRDQLQDRAGRRIIALTVFAKTRMRETAEIARAAAAMASCQQEGHTADEEEDG